MKSFRSLLLASIAAYALVMLLLRLRTYRKRKRSVEWPMISGSFKSSSIDPIRAGYMSADTMFRLKVMFSYSVGISAYSGEYVHDFPTEDDAARLARSLHQGPLYVRCNHVSPAEYVLDPYRDVWQSGSASSTAAAISAHPVVPSPADFKMKRIGRVNWWASSVSLGHLLIFQVAVAIALYGIPIPKPNIGFFGSGRVGTSYGR